MHGEHFAILGTAGHIDHGKTSLVRLLTGKDTDRLKEEKERGISIDLGFAHLDLPGGLSAGIVDVPGHERFVKNMLAGACGMDAIMLVIAADEGVMPQTREHLDILDLLDVKNGVVAMTKVDMVESEWLELVTESVKEYLAARGFGHMPILPVSSKTGAGKDALLAALAKIMAELPDRPTTVFPRLPVDRAFVMEGFGSVVTGTLWQGTIQPGDKFTVQPGGVETRARKVEVHGLEVPSARAGQRTAVALAGVSVDQVPRGSWVLPPNTLEPSHMLDVRVRVLKSAAKELKHRQRVRFHLGASEVLGRVVLLGEDVVEPGGSVLAQLRLESPVVAARRDRFVLRSYSPARAIAGGTVILPVAPKRRRGRPEVLEELARSESGTPEEKVLALLLGQPFGLPPAEVASMTGLAAVECDSALESLVQEESVVLLSARAIAVQTLNTLKENMLQVLSDAASAHPLRWGLRKGELKSLLGKGLPAPLFDRAVSDLATGGDISLRDDAIRKGSHEMQLPEPLAKRVAAVDRALASGGMTPPTVKELETQLGFPPAEMLEHLTFEGAAVKLTPDLFWNHEKFQELTAWVVSRLQTGEFLTMGELREAWGMSRKYTVPVLEHLDREGWTRREGDGRVAGRRLDESS